MADRSSHARGWFLKAESDIAAARRVLDGEGPYDTACFHTQQAAEKYLKGFLALYDEPIPHTHNLEDLAPLCRAKCPNLDLEHVDVTELTPFAVWNWGRSRLGRVPVLPEEGLPGGGGQRPAPGCRVDDGAYVHEGNTVP